MRKRKRMNISKITREILIKKVKEKRVNKKIKAMRKKNSLKITKQRTINQKITKKKILNHKDSLKIMLTRGGIQCSWQSDRGKIKEYLVTVHLLTWVETVQAAARCCLNM